jgi:hypothetical protein
LDNLSRIGFNWLVLICGLFGVACPVVTAIWLFAVVASGNGSHAGNILRVGLGLLLVLIAVLVVGVGAVYLKSSNGRSGSQFGAQS